jgi:hypothetical protein
LHFACLPFSVKKAAKMRKRPQSGESLPVTGVLRVPRIALIRLQEPTGQLSQSAAFALSAGGKAALSSSLNRAAAP